MFEVASHSLRYLRLCGFFVFNHRVGEGAENKVSKWKWMSPSFLPDLTLRFQRLCGFLF
jgi:hypothetical protein